MPEDSGLNVWAYALRYRGGRLSILSLLAFILMMPFLAFGGLWFPLYIVAVVLLCIGMLLFIIGLFSWPLSEHADDEGHELTPKS
jgi:hypothetical protein